MPLTDREQAEPVGAQPARRRRAPILAGIATAGGLVIASQVLPASADTAPQASSTHLPASALAVTPPAGSSWIQGVLTDQAGHALNNVNVEAWSTDPTVTVPVASNLTYAGTPADGRHQTGVFRLEVPAGTPYEVTLSTIGGQEDGDLFRMQAYGGGRPIMTRSTPARLAAGRIIDLGTIQMVRQGTVASKTTARAPKVKPGKRGVLQIKVTSPYVTNVTGKVQVRVGGKKIVGRLAAIDHGSTSVRLPKFKRGTHVVKVMFLGSNTVEPSKAKPVRVKVTKK